MPSSCDPGVPGGKRSTARATFHLPRWEVSHMGAVGLGSAGGPSDSRPASITFCGFCCCVSSLS